MAEELVKKRNWKTILSVILFGFIRIMGTMVFSLQAPFFPAEAEKKGLSTLEYGLIFGCYELFSIIVAPILDRVAKHVPGRTVFLLGTITLGASTCAFGFLNRLQGHWEFLTFSMLLRLVEAIGATTTYVMSSAAVYQEFPTRMATVSAVMEICSGVGMSLGPPIGGVLFQLGGFTLPFLFVGIAVCLTGVLGTCLLPKPPKEGAEVELGSSRPSFFKALKIHSVLLAFSAITISMLALSGMMAVLEPYLRMFHLSTVEVSLMFVAYTGTYTVFGLVWGIICDKTTKTNVVTLIGLVLTVVGYSCSGPISTTMGTPTLALITVALGLVINGIGVNAVVVASMIQLAVGLKEAFPGDDFVYTTVSGLVSSAFCLGGFIGPIAAGAFVDFVNFDSFYYFCIIAHVLLVVPYVHSVAVTGRRVSANSETESRIKSDSKL